MNIEPATGAVTNWKTALADWAIPPAIIDQAPENPWVHPPALFKVEADATFETTPSVRAATDALAACNGSATVLDIGCGGGGSSMALVPYAAALVGVDEQAAMLRNYKEAAARLGIACQTVEGKWPDVSDQTPVADVVVCHHVVYNVGDIGPFIRALTDHARIRVVIELPATHPTSPFNPLWAHFWGLSRPEHPTADDFAAVVLELGYTPTVERFRRPPRKAAIDSAEYVAFVRRRLCLPASRDPEVAEALASGMMLPNDDVVTVFWAGAGGL